MSKKNKATNCQVGLPPVFPKTVLNVIREDGTSEGLPISKKVAQALIDAGYLKGAAEG